jgi:hypothetical protein
MPKMRSSQSSITRATIGNTDGTESAEGPSGTNSRQSRDRSEELALSLWFGEEAQTVLWKGEGTAISTCRRSYYDTK